MSSTNNSNTDAIQSSQNDVPSKVVLAIHNRFPGIELVSLVYASKGTECYLLPDQKVDVDSTMKAGFNINPDQNAPAGVLVYKLQRKNINQSDNNIIYSENEEICTHIYIFWRIFNFKELQVVTQLMDHDENHVWDRDKLMCLAEQCSQYAATEHGFIEKAWLMHDNTVLMIKIDVIREEECYKSEMIISEGSIKHATWRPYYIDMDR
jgi:hypothetical protein